ncbi:putative adenylyl cyclase CyaB [Collimonas sp. PA-H2]|uniref:class IV adenylate cyclase n=1 Tax=Collimonas sp. PA-H2 TaxID=1881062 RepID=UPI000BF85A5A|nr:class IV adenylate cyclase [Collimonas sp. PA-H2]PFH10517.1 putative adenylyl cyclase CyaB [Collimonas sp. PA-H2]
MPRNIEIKARVDSIEALAAIATALGSDGPYHIEQNDTFFSCATGRLKLRSFTDGTGELIYYSRADLQGPKESFYVISPTAAPDTLRECLTLACGQTGRVRKLRTLFLSGRSRIHLDQVAGLGNFMEIEVMLADHEAPAAGMQEAHELMSRLGIRAAQLIEGAYIDLLSAIPDNE